MRTRRRIKPRRIIPQNGLCCKPATTPNHYFHKILGQAEIIDIMQVKAGIGHDGKFTMNDTVSGRKLTGTQTAAIARLDGFKSIDDMFAWLHASYDLKKQKKFWIYQWKWLT